ncbi:MAG: hypothetical protein ACTMKU_04605 [Actinomycetaceae bacterium]
MTGAGPGHDAAEQVDARADGPGTGERILEVVVAVLLTVLVAVAGTVAHRMEQGGFPLGIVLGRALAVVGAVLVRSVSGTAALVLYGGLGLAVVLLMTYWGPGGDVLVTSTPRAMLWILGMPIAAAIGRAAPRAWFSSRPVRLGRRSAVADDVRTDGVRADDARADGAWADGTRTDDARADDVRTDEQS